MRKAFTGLAAVLMLAIVVQFFLAASGAFDTAPTEEAFRPHRILGLGTVLLAILLTVFAALARMPGRLIGRAGLVAGLGVLQPVIVVIAKAFGDTGETTTAGQLVFGLHAVNGLMMMAVVRTILQESRALPGTERTPATAGSARSAS
jgi:heme A synthase